MCLTCHASQCSLGMALVQGEGAEGFILDLRSNPGGLVTAGLDVARLWLDGENVPVFNVRSGAGEEGP